MDSDRRINVNVTSEIGKLDTVLVHAPGKEIENMTPESAHHYLYSDILNLNEALNDYRDFKGTLQKVANVYEIKDLLAETLDNKDVKIQLITDICKSEHLEKLQDRLLDLGSSELSEALIEGLESDNLVLDPLPNLFFMRDASFTMYNNVMISNMTSTVRMRECLILESIYKNHPLIKANVVNPVAAYGSPAGTVEGGDVQIARHDIVLSGNGLRTNKGGIDSLVNHLSTRDGVNHLIYQELPKELDSYIHLDMVFTFLDKDKCMAFAPIVFNDKYHTTHVTIDNGKVVSVAEEANLFKALNKLGMDIEPIYCGGNNEKYAAREQWHSGANFFAMAPGQVLGYERNVYTIDELNKHGFDVLKAADVASGKVNLKNYSKYVVVFKGNELSRGGGGARCMTMPISRQEVDW